jgi:hypothetical protein
MTVALLPLQKMAYLFAALAIVVDGFDGQMIGYAIPSSLKNGASHALHFLSRLPAD